VIFLKISFAIPPAFSVLQNIMSFSFLVSKPAPYWEGTAVINGEFKELKLTDYRGKYLVFFFYPLDL
jgi:hypothetical protein